MTNNDSKSTITLLKEVIDIFPTCACDCIDLFFQKQCSPSSQWYFSDNIDCKTDRIITIGCANNDFQAIMAVGINNPDCRLLLNEEVSNEDFISLFGEFANTYIAMLMDYEEINSRFGILHQSVPVLYSSGMPFLPFISGISGMISVENDLAIKFAFSMNHRIHAKNHNIK